MSRKDNWNHSVFVYHFNLVPVLNIFYIWRQICIIKEFDMYYERFRFIWKHFEFMCKGNSLTCLCFTFIFESTRLFVEVTRNIRVSFDISYWACFLSSKKQALVISLFIKIILHFHTCISCLENWNFSWWLFRGLFTIKSGNITSNLTRNFKVSMLLITLSHKQCRFDKVVLHLTVADNFWYCSTP